MSSVTKLEEMLDEALKLCEKYKKNVEMLLECNKKEREVADQIINAQKALIETYQEKIKLLEDKVRLLEGKE